jgi:hypothetical protein
VALKEPVVPPKRQTFQRTVIFNDEDPHPQPHDRPLLWYYLSIPAGVDYFHPKNKEVPYEGVPGYPIVSRVPSDELEKKIR